MSILIKYFSLEEKGETFLL